MKKKKKGARLSRVKGRLGRVLCWGVAGTARRDPIVPLSRAPGPHWASADPRGAGRTPPARAESRARARGTSTQRSRGSCCAALLLPGWTVQAQGRASIGPKLKGAWPHTPPCPAATPPVPALFLQSKRSSWWSQTCHQVSGWSRDPREGRGGARDPRSREDGAKACSALLLLPCGASSFFSSVMGPPGT